MAVGDILVMEVQAEIAVIMLVVAVAVVVVLVVVVELLVATCQRQVQAVRWQAVGQGQG